MQYFWKKIINHVLQMSKYEFGGDGLKSLISSLTLKPFVIWEQFMVHFHILQEYELITRKLQGHILNFLKS